MNFKKINAALDLLSIVAMLLHIGYTVFAYLAFYYNPTLKLLTAIPFMALACLHAVCGMLTVFLQADGTRMDLYPKKNMRTILQRVSAALIFPLLILHVYTYGLMQGFTQQGQKGLVILVMLGEILFFAVIITHVVTSTTKAFITLGWMTSQKTQGRVDKVLYVIGAIVFVVTVFVIVRAQAFMFLSQ
jgi:hypothetical protein